MHIKKTGPAEDTYNSGPAVPSNWGGLNLGGGGSGGPMRGGRKNSGRDAPYSNNQSWNRPNNGGFNGGNNNFGGPPRGFGGPPQNGGFGSQNNGFGGPPQNQGFSGSGQNGFPQQQGIPPPAVTAPVGKPVGSSDCPFPHCVGLVGIPAGTQNQQIQEFFKPIKAIAVNMAMGNGMGDVAFKTHDEACSAMANNGKSLNGGNITMTLKSQGPPPVHAGFTML